MTTRNTMRVICAMVMALGCGSGKRQVVAERMSEERPAWITSNGLKCENGLSCVIVQGVGEGLSDGRQHARAKGVVELASELGLRIRGRLSVLETQNTIGDQTVEASRLSESVESEVEAYLTDVRTLAEYWERRSEHTSQGQRLVYRVWLKIGVPRASLVRLRMEREQDQNRFNENLHKVETSWRLLKESTNAEQKAVEMLLGQLERLNSHSNRNGWLSIASLNRLSELNEQVKAEITSKVLKRRLEASGDGLVVVQLAMFGLPIVAADTSAKLRSTGKIDAINVDRADRTVRLRMRGLPLTEPVAIDLYAWADIGIKSSLLIDAYRSELDVCIVRIDITGMDVKTVEQAVVQAVKKQPKARICAQPCEHCAQLSVESTSGSVRYSTMDGIVRAGLNLKLEFTMGEERFSKVLERRLAGIGSDHNRAIRDLEGKVKDSVVLALNAFIGSK